MLKNPAYAEGRDYAIVHFRVSVVIHHLLNDIWMEAGITGVLVKSTTGSLLLGLTYFFKLINFVHCAVHSAYK